ncbi:hypothetical protein CYG48_13325 [Neorhizobium sp. SOG26]|uniref:hypothetical protein n=1 Tax=Neorhizobium sp. SOG26 TaxID=2060726 RepID=UPI000E57B2CE|nr:hypothetical protein [Neorhizobium sp. SOG26]AXV16582.1 hypothetical protein CYG48_13325 [Neorhizobium sp. SOG26]
MKSRKTPILQLAEKKSLELIEAVIEDRVRHRANLENVHHVCRALVSRATPLLPTAKLVSEEGLLRDRNFPSPQTIYNSYGQLLRIWRRAYHDLRNINSQDTVSPDQILNVSVMDFDEGSRAVIQELKRHLKEVIQRNNALKDILYREVPVRTDGASAEVGAAMDTLFDWLELVRDAGFWQGGGLYVTRSTPIGTMIMEPFVLSELERLARIWRTGGKTKLSDAVGDEIS